MTADDIICERSKLSCIKSYTSRIQDLFHVRVQIVDNGIDFGDSDDLSDGASTRVCVSSHDSQDCVQEAKVRLHYNAFTWG